MRRVSLSDAGLNGYSGSHSERQALVPECSRVSLSEAGVGGSSASPLRCSSQRLLECPCPRQAFSANLVFQSRSGLGGFSGVTRNTALGGCFGLPAEGRLRQTLFFRAH
ncbi:hypothetical protein NDU88_003958 [Pleurodeles waltl]|uniref:Uncharacterized protein n=1 Tax=Pleurodeles waltl TaxID=8319 RepID=A0AAV7T7S4_PLEWA|nr:hypothetical protein NDU88_003958 [Pleurodeles waltl]